MDSIFFDWIQFDILLKMIIIVAKKRGGNGMNYPFFDIPNDISLEEKVALLERNGLVAKNLREEIKQMKSETPFYSTTLEKREKRGESKTSLEENEKLQLIYSKICLLSSFDRNDLLIKIKECILMENYPITSCIDYLKIKLYQDIVTYASLALEPDGDILGAKEQIADLRLKLELLDEMEEKEEIAQISTEHNQLFFLESQAGNVVALESLRKNIPMEYYDDFKRLFQSIEDGSLKGIKRLRNGLYEVKDFKIRILFGFLQKGKYLVLDAFMKKEDTSEYYKSLIDYEGIITTFKEDVKKLKL